MVFQFLPAALGALGVNQARGFQSKSSRVRSKRRKRAGLQAFAAQEFNRRRGQSNVRQQLQDIISQGGIGLTPDALAGQQQAISSGFGDVRDQLQQRIQSAAQARGVQQAGTTGTELNRADIQVGKAEQSALSNLAVQNELAKRASLMEALGLRMDLRNMNAQEAQMLFAGLQQRKQQELQGDMFRGQLYQGLFDQLGQSAVGLDQGRQQFVSALRKQT